jgi:hypothetical protein
MLKISNKNLQHFNNSNSIVRKFSEVTSNQELSTKITSLESKINDNKDAIVESLKTEFSAQFSKLEATINQSVNAAIQSNNANVAVFVFNAFKSIFENSISDEKLISTVNSSYLSSNLGTQPIIIPSNSQQQQQHHYQNSSYNSLQTNIFDQPSSTTYYPKPNQYAQ